MLSRLFLLTFSSPSFLLNLKKTTLSDCLRHYRLLSLFATLPIHSKNVPIKVPSAINNINRFQSLVTRAVITPAISPRVAPPQTAFGPLQYNARRITAAIVSTVVISTILSLSPTPLNASIQSLMTPKHAQLPFLLLQILPIR